MTDPSKTISITLINDEKVRESTTQPTLELALKQLINSLSGRNIETATRLIDSTQGSVASFDFGPIKGYAAIYFPTIDPKHLEVALLSTYLWDEGTLQLLKTIHIEMVTK